MHSLVGKILAISSLVLAPLSFCQSASANPVEAAIPDSFDSIGTPVASLTNDAGRTIHYTDTGEEGWRTMLFIGGAGTSARAPEMVAYLDTMRRNLKLRIVAVERNGFGDTALDPTWDFDDYNQDVSLVLDHLGVDRFVLMAISGGGTYAGHIASAMPKRVISMHLMAAMSYEAPESPNCQATDAQLAAVIGPMTASPRVWWALPATGVSGLVPGFADRAADEGARTYFMGGQGGSPAAMVAEYRRFCRPAADISALKSPLYLYYGEADEDIPPYHGEYWAAHTGGEVTFRRYAGEGHDTQYRHWDQLLLEAAGHGDSTLVCACGKASLRKGLVYPAQLGEHESLGICAWQRAEAARAEAEAQP